MIAAYIRVSTKQQNHALQEKAIQQWAAAHGHKVKLFRDKFTGKSMDRPGWNALEADMLKGRVDTLVCWRLDRLGRTSSGLTKLFDFLKERKIRLVSLTESFDLGTSMGRLVADILASVAAFETEVRSERVSAGQAEAKASGRRWGGSVKGWSKVKPATVKAIKTLHGQGTPKATIAKMLSLSWPTIHKVLGGGVSIKS